MLSVVFRLGRYSLEFNQDVKHGESNAMNIIYKEWYTNDYHGIVQWITENGTLTNYGRLTMIVAYPNIRSLMLTLYIFFVRMSILLLIYISLNTTYI